jgi:hypothetical protein
MNPIHTISSYLPKIHFNIAHPPMFWSSQWSLSLWHSHQYPICIPLANGAHTNNKDNTTTGLHKTTQKSRTPHEEGSARKDKE